MVKETLPATSQPNVPVPAEPVPSVTVAEIAPSSDSGRGTGDDAG